MEQQCTLSRDSVGLSAVCCGSALSYHRGGVGVPVCVCSWLETLLCATTTPPSAEDHEPKQAVVCAYCCDDAYGCEMRCAVGVHTLHPLLMRRTLPPLKLFFGVTGVKPCLF